MAAVSSTSSISSVTLQDSNTVTTIYNKILTLANTEYFLVLPVNTKKFLLKCRSSFPVKLSYLSGDSGILFLTIPSGTTYIDNSFYSSQTLYYQSSQSGIILEIVVFN
jgi:hypothetical protein